jgi:hypothetical protein
MGRLVGVKTPYIDVVLGLVQQLGRSLRIYPTFPETLVPDLPTHAKGRAAVSA